MRSKTSTLLLALAWVLPITSSCSSTSSSTQSGSGGAEWLEASPTLAQEIKTHANRLPWVHGIEERVDIIQWFAGAGEPAYTTLLELASDSRPQVAGSALAALGATRDSRLVEYIQRIKLSEDSDETLRFERARALLTLGDWESAVPTLIDGLRNEGIYVRALALRTLSEATGHRFEFEARAGDEDRQQAIERWEEWWSSQSQDALRSKHKRQTD